MNFIRHVAKRRSDPRQAYPDFKVQVLILVLVLGIEVPFSPSGRLLVATDRCCHDVAKLR